MQTWGYVAIYSFFIYVSIQTECEPGFWKLDSGDICQKCNLPGCICRTSADNCKGCLTGYYMDIYLCKPCKANCLSCSNSTTCQNCTERYTGNLCEPVTNCSTNCKCATENICSDCKAGYYNPSKYCNDKCQVNCETCSGSNICTACKSGFYGTVCNLTCSRGCNDGSCNKQNGTCSCKAEFAGVMCDVCVPGKYGDLCDMNCSLGCTGSQHVCNKIDGHCTCFDKFAGRKCDQCEGGIYGYNCESECSAGCENDCNRSDGTCACKSNFNGDTCSRCVSGRYGNNCDKLCSEGCIENVCHKETGSCTCLINFNGPSCDQCQIGFYGSNCSLQCPQNCEPPACKRIDGVCFSCREGFYGVKCESHCNTNCQRCEHAEGTHCETFQASHVNTADVANSVTIISGGVGGAVVVILIGVLLVVYCRRRQCMSRNPHENIPHQNTNELNDEHVYANVQQNNEDEASTRRSAIIFEERECVYYNSSSKLETRKIMVSYLQEFIANTNINYFEEEFEKLPNGLTRKYEESQRSINMSRNRYKGIYPYDASRVKVLGGITDYINASFIDGYKRRNAFIATLGPMSKQLDDFAVFWRMIWQQKVEAIVMLTNLVEEGKNKCEQYWPDVSSSAMYGDIRVACTAEDKYDEFIRSTFVLNKTAELRSMYHLHFTAWPDKGVPEDVTSILEFRQMVLNVPSILGGPTVVHCSAGVGRTGIYIARDILTREGEAEHSVDVTGCVINMRKNRPNMVQTVEQYEYLHRALIHYLTFGCEQIVMASNDSKLGS